MAFGFFHPRPALEIPSAFRCLPGSAGRVSVRRRGEGLAQLAIASRVIAFGGAVLREVMYILCYSGLRSARMGAASGLLEGVAWDITAVVGWRGSGEGSGFDVLGASLLNGLR